MVTLGVVTKFHVPAINTYEGKKRRITEVMRTKERKFLPFSEITKHHLNYIDIKNTI